MRPCLVCREKQQGKLHSFPAPRAPEAGRRLLRVPRIVAGKAAGALEGRTF